MNAPVSHPWSERLSEYADGGLDATDCVALEAHLAECEACVDLLASLRAVRRRASAVEPRLPATDLWPAIESRILGREVEAFEAVARAPGTVADPPEPIPLPVPRRPWWRRQLTMGVPQAVAASIVLVALSGAAAWFTLRVPATETATDAPPLAAEPAPGDALPVGYERTIRELEAMLAEHRDRLDPGTIAVVESNLAIIDEAIAESRRAIASDPESPYLYRHLNRQMQQKVALLQQAAVVAYAGP